MREKSDRLIKAQLPAAETVRAGTKNLIFIVVGAFLIAVSLNALLIPYGLLAGGVTGLALILFYMWKVPVFFSILLLNIPIFWWGSRETNSHFLFYSIVGTLALAALQPATYGSLPSPQVDLILVAIFGGAVSGAGMGLVFRGNGSTGGADIIAVILRKKKNLAIGEVGFYSNLVVIAISLAYFPLNIGLYTIVSMFVAGKVTDVLITGLNTSKSVMIISNQPFLIADRIIHHLHRGVTYLAATGGFTREERTVINCVVNRFELARLKSIVAETDPDAFMYISDASEVLGRGFTKKKEAS